MFNFLKTYVTLTSKGGYLHACVGWEDSLGEKKVLKFWPIYREDCERVFCFLA